uniref:Uncharacterized protein n=1 Tax=Nothobranchius kuhntae TaxID=321403 RepID=A0A1A8IGV9_NOTKU
MSEVWLGGGATDSRWSPAPTSSFNPPLTSKQLLGWKVKDRPRLVPQTDMKDLIWSRRPFFFSVSVVAHRANDSPWWLFQRTAEGGAMGSITNSDRWQRGKSSSSCCVFVYFL